jgi:choline dehydrogenase-like flavoprotein
MQSSEARGDQLDIHIAVTRLIPPEHSSTGGAISLSVAVVKPDSRGAVTLRSRDPRDQPQIDCNYPAEDRDARRMLEGVKLARKIGRNPALARFLGCRGRHHPARAGASTAQSRISTRPGSTSRSRRSARLACNPVTKCPRGLLRVASTSTSRT